MTDSILEGSVLEKEKVTFGTMSCSEVGAVCCLSRRAFQDDSQRVLLSFQERGSQIVGRQWPGPPLALPSHILTCSFYSEYGRKVACL